MASYYVYSGAAGSANGSSWANAYLNLPTAISGKSGGDVLYVAHDHSESTTSCNLTSSSSSVTNPVRIICVDRSGSVPPVNADRRATAQVTTSANNTITINGYQYYDGIIFVAGNSTGVANINMLDSIGGTRWLRCDNCSFRIGSTGAGKIGMGAFGATETVYIELNNSTMSFSGTGQGVDTCGRLKWRNTASALIGSAVPTSLFFIKGSAGADIECVGVDFSAAGSGKTIVGANGSGGSSNFRFVDCKLNASVTKSTVPASYGSTEIDYVRSGASGVNYTVYRHRLSGELSEETTIVRTGGASDGTTPLSWKILTTANNSYLMPFECPPIAIWNDTIGSAVTATVEGIAAALPTDEEVWLDVEYLGDASSPQGSFINDGRANLLTTAANQTSSSATWGGSTTAFKLACTFTPQQKGWIYARVKVGKASATIYVDPLVTLT